MGNTVIIYTTKLSGGGAQRVVSNLSKELTSFYELKIVLNDGKQVTYSYSGKVIDLNTPAKNSFLKRFINTIFRIIRLSLIKKNKDVIASISFLDNANIVNLLSGFAGKTIISIRNYKSKHYNGVYGKFFRLMVKLLYSKCDYIVVPSKGIRDNLADYYNIKKESFKVIYNPCDTEMIVKSAQEKINSCEWEVFKDPVLITAGRLSRQKGHWHLIRSFQEIKSKIPKMRLVILGEGDLENELKFLVNKLGFTDSVIFMGFQKNPFKYIANSSIFILPSLYEGFPNILLEAMACGIPVVATDCNSGPREILSPGTDHTFKSNIVEDAEYGVLTPVFSFQNSDFYDEGLTNEEKLMADAVINLFYDQQKYENYKSKGVVRVKDFAPDKIADKWVKIIDI